MFNFKFVTKAFLYHLLIILILLSNFSCAKPNQDRKSIILDLVLEKLYSDHFERKAIDDEFSKKLFKNYLENIDPSKLYFTQEDIKYLSKYKATIDDELKIRNLDFFNDVNKIISKKTKNVVNEYKKILSNKFDFNKKEKYTVNPKEFPKNEKERKERIKKQLKLMILENLVVLENHNSKSFDENLKKSTTKIKENLEDHFFLLSKVTEEKRFEIFINTIASLFDPHTNYLFPSDLDTFNTQISGEFEGIGATLQQTKKGIKVVNIITGGPAWKEGSLKPNDILLFLKSDTVKEPLNLSTMDLSKAISYIKGKKGTNVTLTVKHIDGSIKNITITRDIVKLEDTYAQSAIINDHNHKIGYIKLPTFYVKRNANIGRDSSKDIETILKKLNKQKTDSLIFDLRGNGGGSLNEVSKMIGLFIKKGPVVQVKYHGSPTHIQMDNDNRITYKKPIIVLVDKFSASASEIFTAAIQDYKRGIIVGTKQTYGKGTVQVVFPMEPFARKFYNYKKPIGAFKITIQKFYRINGGATQLKGVASDIVLPNLYSKIKVGEASQKYPIKWDRISPANYTPLKLNTNLNLLKEKSKNRISKNLFFKKIKNASVNLSKMQNKKTIDIDYLSFKQNYFKNEKTLDLEKNKKDLLNINSIEKFREKADIENNQRFIKNIKNDQYIKEASNIINDWLS